jgi:hypothetical protein
MINKLQNIKAQKNLLPSIGKPSDSINPIATGENTMKQIEYTNKPSITTLRAAIRKSAATGETWIQLIWGENQITIEKTPRGWYGEGWIGRNGGQDLAAELAISERSGASTDRLIVKHIGA